MNPVAAPSYTGRLGRCPSCVPASLVGSDRWHREATAPIRRSDPRGAAPPTPPSGAPSTTEAVAGSRPNVPSDRLPAVVIPVTLLIVFLLLYASFNSFKNSALILLNIPLALVGGIIGLWITGQNLSVPASVGFIAAEPRLVS